jgi:ketosteroid isomerase-like protein
MQYRNLCERFLAAMEVQDFGAMAVLMHPDFIAIEAAGLPYGGTYRGIEGWRALNAAVVGSWGGFRLKLLEILGETEDSLVVHFAISGRSRKTGKTFETTVLELWRFSNDLLLRIDPYYFDTHLLVITDSV